MNDYDREELDADPAGTMVTRRYLSIGFVGLGAIGSAVARHLLASGHKVTVWARRPSALSDFAARGGIVASSLSEIGEADIIISVVFDDDATREVVLGPAGFIHAMRPGSIHVAMETISPALSRELYDSHTARGQHYLAAPVFGRPEAAEAGQLGIMCSGGKDVYVIVAPILAFAGTPRWVGPQAEQAMLVKLIGNHMILTMGELLGETFAFLRAGGISGAESKAALLDDLIPTVLAGYAQRMADQPETSRPAASRIGRKDNALVLDVAERMNIDLPLARLIAGL
ncbi:NAD(P)-dependent oxidoreductase [Glacieibacterium megasporae]|uniref:NAD(P)-dependent oxidoreductase n=1 Tax=Glacieibacterium megasporae TaxID=2835787 RepID=UPI001C1DE5D1|nr:NAD(P)-dependent oxidoreductase [Polymorphobacter megasporae]UAJ10652.1 NAD(P)-dependent oxidoreductase [Polymorphobacter megasporae]